MLPLCRQVYPNSSRATRYSWNNSCDTCVVPMSSTLTGVPWCVAPYNIACEIAHAAWRMVTYRDGGFDTKARKVVLDAIDHHRCVPYPVEGTAKQHGSKLPRHTIRQVVHIEPHRRLRHRMDQGTDVRKNGGKHNCSRQHKVTCRREIPVQTPRSALLCKLRRAGASHRLT